MYVVTKASCHADWFLDAYLPQSALYDIIQRVLFYYR